MGRIDKLAERYERYLALPWEQDLAGAERVIFLVYDKSDERRLRARKTLFELATRRAGHHWQECDLTAAFARWMAGIDYRDSYFESPEDLELKLEEDFAEYAAAWVRETLRSPQAGRLGRLGHRRVRHRLAVRVRPPVRADEGGRAGGRRPPRGVLSRRI